MDDRGITQSEALKEIRENDRVRRAFVESDFRFNYTDSREFDFILDTSLSTPDVCLEFLSKSLKDHEWSTSDKRPLVTDLKVEPVLVKHVADMLKYFDGHRKAIEKRTEV